MPELLAELAALRVVAVELGRDDVDVLERPPGELDLAARLDRDGEPGALGGDDVAVLLERRRTRTAPSPRRNAAMPAGSAVGDRARRCRRRTGTFSCSSPTFHSEGGRSRARNQPTRSPTPRTGGLSAERRSRDMSAVILALRVRHASATHGRPRRGIARADAAVPTHGHLWRSGDLRPVSPCATAGTTPNLDRCRTPAGILRAR